MAQADENPAPRLRGPDPRAPRGTVASVVALAFIVLGNFGVVLAAVFTSILMTGTQILEPFDDLTLGAVGLAFWALNFGPACALALRLSARMPRWFRVGSVTVLAAGLILPAYLAAHHGVPFVNCDHGAVGRQERVRVVAKREVGSDVAVRRYLDLERPDGTIVSLEVHDPGTFGIILRDGRRELPLNVYPGRLGHDWCRTSSSMSWPGGCVYFW